MTTSIPASSSTRVSSSGAKGTSHIGSGLRIVGNKSVDSVSEPPQFNLFLGSQHGTSRIECRAEIDEQSVLLQSWQMEANESERKVSYQVCMYN